MIQGLEVRGLVRHFGGVKAVDGVSFDVRPGECVALIGPNGAGKSTCFACIAGQQVPTAGEVRWMGQRLDGKSPQQRLVAGVGRSFQVAQVFESLTVLQNIELLSKTRRRLSVDFLAMAGLGGQSHTPAGTLAYGAKKRLELAMVLAGEPQLLLLDEPAAGLAAHERQQMMKLIQKCAAEGMAVLYTEHNMDAVFGIADRVLVLLDGRLAASGSADEVRASPLVQHRYLGLSESRATALPKLEYKPDRDADHVALLRVESLSAWWGDAQALFEVSLSLKGGECGLLRGLNGAGKSTLLQAIAGVGPQSRGRIHYSGTDVARMPSYDRAAAGMGWVPEDRRLYVSLTVEQNLRLAARGSSAEVRRLEAEVLELFPALRGMMGRLAAQMSGGEQQMLAIARTLMMRPQLLLLDEPCEGIAPVLVDSIVAALGQLKHRGVTMLVAEQHPAMEPLADRTWALTSGVLQ